MTESERLERRLAALPTVAYALEIRGEDWVPIWVSPSFTPVLGYPAGEIVGCPNWWIDRIHPDDREIAYRRTRPQAANGGASLEYRFLHRDGSYRWIHDEMRVARRERDRPVEVVGTLMEIEDRKRAETALRQSEERFRTLVEGSIQGILVSRDAKPLFANQALAEMLGYDDPHQIVALESDMVLVAPEDRERVRRYDKARQSGAAAPDSYEFQALHRDGSVIWLENRVRLVDWPDGPAVMVTVADVSERKRAVEELRRRSAQHEDILEHLDEGVSMADAELRLTSFNRRFLELLDFPAERFPPGTPFEDFIRYNAERGEYGPGDVDKLVSDRVKLARRFEPHRIERTRPDGTTIEIRGNPLPTGGFVTSYTDTTARKRAEDELRRMQEELERRVEQRTEQLARSERRASDAHARLIDAVESISDGFTLYDADERLVVCNSRYRDFYPGVADMLVPGAKLEELARTAYERGAVRRTAGGIDAWMRRRLEQHRSAHGSHEQQLADGRWVLATERRMRDGGTVSVRTDITELKRNAEALRASEEQVRLLLNSTAEAIYGIDLEGNCTFCNPACVELLGHQRAEDLLGHHIHELMHHTRPDGTPYAKDNCHICQTVLGGQGAHGDDEVLWRQDGRSFTAEYWAYPIRRSGEIVGAVVTFLDITERRRAERALRESEARLRAIMDNAPFQIYLKDLDGRHVLVNRETEQLHARPGKTVVGRTAHELYPAAAADVHLAHDRAVVESGRRIDQEYVIPREGGADRFLSIKFPIPDAGGNVRTIGAFTIDITERKQQEEQLRQAQKMEAVGQLTGGVAHDFNNLLTVVIGNLELLGEQIEGDALARRFLDASQHAATRGAELTHRLLAFSRKQALKPEPVDAPALVGETVELLRRTLGADVDICTVPAVGDCRALADRNQLANALVNLAVNARDAMPEGGKLTIETANVRLDRAYADRHADLTPGAYIMIAVSDTGTGMPAHVAARVFEPFFTTKPVGQGSGLGLSMVYGFAKQSGGHVAIYSEEGQGTTVKLFLPPAREPHPGVAPAATGVLPGGEESILVVEDDADVRTLVATSLERLGYRVAEAEDGLAALALLGAGPDIDLLLTDVVLPGGMNGREVAQAAARIAPGARCLFMSGYTEQAIVHHGRLDPGVELLAKPFTREGLARKVRQVLDREGS